MDIDTLINEGWALSKPSFHLSNRPNSRGVVAYWGGVREDMHETLPPEVTMFNQRRHILTVDEKLFAELDLEQRIKFGAVGLFEWKKTDGNSTYRLESDPREPFSGLSCSGIPLYADLEPSFPPFEAVCLYGSEAVADWLYEQGLKRHDYWRVQGEIVGQYMEAFVRQSAFYQNSADVIVGGWHMIWSEDDYYIPAEMRLLFLTLRNAEPWFEGWFAPATASFMVYPRIT